MGKSSNLLVTGAYGFLGSNTISILLKKGYKVLGVDLKYNEKGEKLLRSLGIKDFKIFFLNLKKLDSLDYIFNTIRPEAIFHLAGASIRKDNEKSFKLNFESNVLPIFRLIEVISKSSLNYKPIIFYPGSQMEYGLAKAPWKETYYCKPLNSYGLSKLICTELLSWARRKGIANTYVIRFPLIFGPGQKPEMFVPELIISILKNNNFQMTKGEQKRSFIYVKDACKILLNIYEKAKECNKIPMILNSPSYNPISIREVALNICQILEAKSKLNIGALSYRKDEKMNAWPDSFLAESLGFKINSNFYSKLKETVSWYKKNKWFFLNEKKRI